MTDILLKSKRVEKRGKRHKILRFSIILTLFLLLCMPVIIQCEAETGNAATAELNENISEQIKKLDLADLEAYVSSLETFGSESVSERLLSYIGGEGFDYGGFLSQIANVLFENVRNMLPVFACVCAIAILCGVVNALKSNFTDKTTTEAVFLVGYISVLIPVLAVLTECFSQAKGSVASLQKQMQLVFPLLITLMAASGGSVSAAIYQPAAAFLSTTIVSLVTNVIFPFTLTIIAFSVAGNLTKELKLNKFADFFKSVNKWLIGIGVSVFGIFFTVQGLTSSTYDGITRRAAKYAIGTGVPIVGGFLSGGFDLALAGSVLIKNSLGSLSVFLLVAVLFEPLTVLIAANIFLRLTAAVTQPIGETRIPDFLTETANNLNYCTAGLLFVAFLYFVTVVLLICSSEVIF